MLSKEPQCIIRNLDEPVLTSKNMTCLKAIEAAQSGHWGTDCQIEEVYIFGNEFPCLLRKIALYSKCRGFKIVETDKSFNNFLRNKWYRPT